MAKFSNEKGFEEVWQDRDPVSPNALKAGVSKLSVKGQTVNVFSSVSHMVCPESIDNRDMHGHGGFGPL